MVFYDEIDDWYYIDGDEDEQVHECSPFYAQFLLDCVDEWENELYSRIDAGIPVRSIKDNLDYYDSLVQQISRYFGLRD